MALEPIQPKLHVIGSTEISVSKIVLQMYQPRIIKDLYASGQLTGMILFIYFIIYLEKFCKN